MKITYFHNSEKNIRTSILKPFERQEINITDESQSNAFKKMFKEVE